MPSLNFALTGCRKQILVRDGGRLLGNVSGHFPANFPTLPVSEITCKKATQLP